MISVLSTVETSRSRNWAAFDAKLSSLPKSHLPKDFSMFRFSRTTVRNGPTLQFQDHQVGDAANGQLGHESAFDEGACIDR